jgi:hypothetical protein
MAFDIVLIVFIFLPKSRRGGAITLSFLYCLFEVRFKLEDNWGSCGYVKSASWELEREQFEVEAAIIPRLMRKAY